MSKTAGSKIKVNELINNFKEYIVNTDFKEKIAKIFIFGSHVKGYAVAESDIDILIFITDGKNVEKQIMDRVYDFMMEKDAPLEVIISNIYELLVAPNYFIYNVTHYGLEVYSMEKEKMKKVLIEELKTLSEEYLESAEEVLKTSRLRVAIDAAYNAAELAAKGLILLKQDDLPGSHGGVVSVFGKLYIKTNEVDKEIGRRLNIALKLRNEARYKPDAILTKEDALEVLNLAKELVEIVYKSLKS